jgi:hypothetical protein
MLVFRPLTEFFAGDEPSRLLQKDGQNLNRLALQLQLLAELEQLGRLHIEVEGTEAQPFFWKDGHKAPVTTPKI